MSTQSYVQVPPNSTGSKIDTTELTRSDATVVERQNIAIGDPTQPNSLANVTTAGELTVTVTLDDVLGQLKRIALLLEIMTGHAVSLRDAA